jgi:hypothetical protein
MKGTLFSADFIKNTAEGLKLLEINTDTGFATGSYSHLDLSSFNTVLTDNSITEVHVVYKDFQANFVDHLSESVAANVAGVNTFSKTLEEVNTIYPTTITDSSSKFILRLAYDEAAILDSTYAKDSIKLHKIFVDNNSTGSVPQICVSSSAAGWDYDSLTGTAINEDNYLPDVTVKSGLTSIVAPLKFYKAGNSSGTNDERVTGLKNSLKADEHVIQRYYNTGTTKVSSIRSYNIVYGTDLALINIGNYTTEAILEKPTSLTVDDSQATNELDVKHYFEFTTNDLRAIEGGVLEGTGIIDAAGNSTAIESLSVGAAYKSYIVSGSPDSDESDVIRAWSHAGSSLPAGSHVTSSVLVNSTEVDLKYNSIANLSVSGSDDDSISISPYLLMLVYDIANDKICYRTPYEITPATHKMFDTDGDLVELDEVSIAVLSGSYNSYILDMEETDTFFIEGSNVQVKLLTHNCFLADTQIATPFGSVAVQDIEPGQKVLSFDENTNEQIEGTVNQVLKAKTLSHIKLTFDNGQSINTTKSHPYFVEERGWIKAQSLLKGDICKLRNGDNCKVESVESFKGDYTIYNLHGVSPAHTFFANDILVHNKCFVAGTEITLGDGTTIGIENIEPGKTVMTYNTDTSSYESKLAQGVSKHKVGQIVKITYDDGNIIVTTPEHPFYVFGKDWVKAKDIVSNDTCALIDPEELSEIKVSKVEVLDEEHFVYNVLDVVDNHNFFANGILVHNK